MQVVVCGIIPYASSFQSAIPITLSKINSNHQHPHGSSTLLDVATGGTQEVSTPSLEDELKKTYQDGMIDGKVGNWEELHGNWILRPPSTQETPRALLHFLGGALVGASPHITYRYLCERLAEKGFLVVATPYQLSFDHLQTCDGIITRFELMAPAIARQYGALPVVGIGHSCGALLHLLITCLFPDTPRAANALVSFNNKEVKEAVPFFEEIFTPFFTSLATPVTTNGTLPTSNELIQVGLELAKSATKGELPSDETLQKLFLFPGGPISQDEIKVPKELRETFAKTFSPTVGALKEAGLLPIVDQTIVSLQQIPKLVGEVGGVSFFRFCHSRKISIPFLKETEKSSFEILNACFCFYSSDQLNRFQMVRVILFRHHLQSKRRLEKHIVLDGR